MTPTSSLTYPTPILSPVVPMVEMTCGSRKKTTTDWSSDMNNRSSSKTLIVSSLLLVRNVFVSTYSSLVSELLKILLSYFRSPILI